MPDNRVHTHKKMAITMRTEEVGSHVNNLMRAMLKTTLGYEDEYYGDQYYGSIGFERIVGNYN